MVPEFDQNEDIKLDPEAFNYVCAELDYFPTSDLFATAQHHQLPRYFSPYPDSDAAGINAFAYDWSQELAPYANPPWSLIPQVMKKILEDQAR